MMDPLPQGVVLARESDALSHGHVMYGLVKPCKEGGIQSAAGMANVIPRKRIYRMVRIDELDCFKEEIMKRPLVLQPSVQVGSGLQKINCFFNVKKENWVMMINQMHPKIKGRILSGIEEAKVVMRTGSPFLLEFTFSDILKRLYFDIVGKPVTRFEKLLYMDCDHGDMVIRFAGNVYQGTFGMKSEHIKFSFEDIVLPEVRFRTVSDAAAERPSPIIQVIPEYEMKYILPGWKFEEAEVEEEEEEEEEEVEGAVGYQSYEQPGSSYVTFDDAAVNPEPAPDRPARIIGRANRNKKPVKYEVPVDLHVPNSDVNVERGDNSGERYQDNRFDRVDIAPPMQRYPVESVKPNDSQPSRGILKGDNSRTKYDDGGLNRVNNPHVQDRTMTPYDDSRDYNHQNHQYEQYRYPSSPSNYKTSEKQYDGVYSPGNHSYHYHQGSGRSASSATDSGFDEHNENGGLEYGKYGHNNHHQEKLHRDLYEHREGSHKPYDNPAFRYDHSPKDNNKTMAAEILQYQNYDMHQRSPRPVYNIEKEMDKYSERSHDTKSSQDVQWTGLQSEAVSESFI